MTETDKNLSRRTLAKGVAWSIPAVAVTAYAPAYAASPSTTTTTLLPCVSNLGAVSGTYPVTYTLSGCQTDDSHWDFNFSITVAAQSGTDCDCSRFRVTLFDNPKRSRLWIINQPFTPNPSTNTANSPRLYVQKILNPGQTATFPTTGDQVHRVSGTIPYTSFTTGGTLAGSIEPHGQSNDSLHVLMLPNGNVPCSASGPMAYYTVECENSDGTWRQLGGLGEINPCVPMIASTVCRYDTTGNGRYRLGVSVLRSCGIPASTFEVTKIQRNSDTNFPNEGSSVWSGSTQLGSGVTNIETTTAGSGSQLWIDFTTDGGVNTSTIRVPVPSNTPNCAAAPPTLVSAENNQSACPSGDRTIAVAWTGAASKIQYRVANSSDTFTGNWTDANLGQSQSPQNISLSGESKCRRVEVRLCTSGNNQTCNGATAAEVVPALTAPVPPSNVSATNVQSSCPTGPGATRQINVTWDGDAARLQYQVRNVGNDGWNSSINVDNPSSPHLIALTGDSRCRRVQVRLCTGTTNSTCSSTWTDVPLLPS